MKGIISVTLFMPIPSTVQCLLTDFYSVLEKWRHFLAVINTLSSALLRASQTSFSKKKDPQFKRKSILNHCCMKAISCLEMVLNALFTSLRFEKKNTQVDFFPIKPDYFALQRREKCTKTIMSDIRLRNPSWLNLLESDRGWKQTFDDKYPPF